MLKVPHALPALHVVGVGDRSLRDHAQLTQKNHHLYSIKTRSNQESNHDPVLCSLSRYMLSALATVGFAYDDGKKQGGLRISFSFRKMLVIDTRYFIDMIQEITRLSSVHIRAYL
jgi:hypothetical protein